MTSGRRLSILFVAAPLVGHVGPLLPLARAAVDAGHRVCVLTGGEGLRIEVPGIRSVEVSGPPRVSTGLKLALRHPRLSLREATGRAGIPLAGAIFGALNAEMLDRVLAEARAFGPDVVVHEPFAPAGLVAARHLGVRAVLQQISLWDPHEVHGAALAGLAGRRAVPSDGRPDATISITPPGLMDVRCDLRIRGIPASGDGALPAWLDRPAERPRILVSRSTTNSGPGQDVVRRVVAAAPNLDADVVLLRATRRRRLPPNVHAVGWVPLDRALRHATAFVHHGGSGGLLQALAAGVPQLATPGIADRRHNAETLDRTGAGIGIEARDVTAAVLERLVHDPTLRAGVTALQHTINALPDPATALALLADLE